MKQLNGRVGLILIGDELLNGVRQDKHMAHVMDLLKARGMKLAWVRMVADEQEMLLETFQQTQQSDEIVFSFGGIGATPDDLTRQCAAEAFGLDLFPHPQAIALIERQFGDAAYPKRVIMGHLPDTSTLIPNPINNIAGFKVAHHHFVPGFPNMAWPMVEWVLDTHYPHLHHLQEGIERRWTLKEVPESDLIDMMEDLLECFDKIGVSSLPDTNKRHQIDFGIKGDREQVEAASELFVNFLQQENITHKLNRSE